MLCIDVHLPSRPSVPGEPAGPLLFLQLLRVRGAQAQRPALDDPMRQRQDSHGRRLLIDTSEWLRVLVRDDTIVVVMAVVARWYQYMLREARVLVLHIPERRDGSDRSVWVLPAGGPCQQLLHASCADKTRGNDQPNTAPGPLLYTSAPIHSEIPLTEHIYTHPSPP